MALSPSIRPRPLFEASSMTRTGLPMSDRLKGEQWTPGAAGGERLDVEAGQQRQKEEETAEARAKAARVKSRAWTAAVRACQGRAARPPRAWMQRERWGKPACLRIPETLRTEAQRPSWQSPSEI